MERSLYIALQTMNTKPAYLSKELWVLGIGLLNMVSNRFGYPSIEPTTELYGAVLVLVGVLRVFFTNSKLTWKK